jgi:putative nucleotidyltransferase with HDIG domain
MKKSAVIFAALVASVGTLLGLFCLYLVIGQLIRQGPDSLPVAGFLTITILFIICRSLPLYITPNSAIDMSFMCLFACMLLSGPQATAAMVVISTPFTFEIDRAGGQHFFTIFNMSPLKTLFNMGNPVLAVLIAGVFYTLLGGVPGNITLPGVLLPAAVFVAIVLLLNSSILFLLLSLNGQVVFGLALRSDLVQLLPTFFCAAPIGFFMSFLMKMPSGPYLAVLFMMPMMLARYAFKMYLDNRQSYYKLLHTLAAAIEAKDECTNGHSRRVEQYASILARAMHLSRKDQELVSTAALLHDIGKIGINDAILNKPGALTPQEREIINTHPQIAVNILGDSDVSPQVLDIILHHHEYYDGRGYPLGTKGDEISILCYVLSTVDALDVITSDRPYRKGRSFEAAEQILLEESGKQFHPDCVKALISVKEEIIAVMRERS